MRYSADANKKYEANHFIGMLTVYQNDRQTVHQRWIPNNEYKLNNFA